jgi:RNA polymerase sigma-70 factor (ECF subfamily)
MGEEQASTPEAFRHALTEEIPRLRRFARVLVRHGDGADDLVQETLLRAMAARAQFEAGTNLRAWLFTILRHARAAEARRDARSPFFSPATMPDAAVSGGQEERQAMRDLIVAFRRLPAIQRDALWLVVVDGLDYGEAAAMLGVPPGTLRSRLSRAREALRRGIGLLPPEGPTLAGPATPRSAEAGGSGPHPSQDG